jgi:hypothetical protein
MWTHPPPKKEKSSGRRGTAATAATAIHAAERKTIDGLFRVDEVDG